MNLIINDLQKRGRKKHSWKPGLYAFLAWGVNSPWKGSAEEANVNLKHQAIAECSGKQTPNSLNHTSPAEIEMIWKQ